MPYWQTLKSLITHLEPDILECEVKWTLGSITTKKGNGGDGIPIELFQILKVDAVKVLHSICQQIWKTQQWPQDWKRSAFIPIPKKSNAKECSNYHTIALISTSFAISIRHIEIKYAFHKIYPFLKQFSKVYRNLIKVLIVLM